MDDNRETSGTKTGFWNFKDYTEKRWFRFLSLRLFYIGIFYFIAHIALNTWFKEYSYEYTTLNQDQLQLVSRIYSDTESNKNIGVMPSAKTGTATDTTKKDTLRNAGKASGTKVTKTTAKSIQDTTGTRAPTYLKIMHYLKNAFNGKLDAKQADDIQSFLSEARPMEATTFLANERFLVRSYFWLNGPFVYLEVILWAVIGVLCSLLFNLGVLSRNATTDLANPQSIFDSSEIPFQVAKILYAPVCTLIVILGYNFFKDQNIVDISSSKGVIVFSFICGFYSSRVIALMDRLKEVLLPNSGIHSLPATAAGTSIPTLTVKVSAEPGALTPADLAAIGENWMNDIKVSVKSSSTGTTVDGTPDNDGRGGFTFKNLASGMYIITAEYKYGLSIQLIASKTGNIGSSIAPVRLSLKKATV